MVATDLLTVALSDLLLESQTDCQGYRKEGVGNICARHLADSQRLYFYVRLSAGAPRHRRSCLNRQEKNRTEVMIEQ